MELMKNKYLNLAKQIYFDTDCLASFLLVEKEEIIEKLFKGRIVIPRQVYAELDRPAIRNILKIKLDNFIKNSKAKIYYTEINTNEERLYKELICGKEGKSIGSGEAICIALAKTFNGILSSNNLKDICLHIKKYSLEFITTGNILVMALKEELINESEGEAIWQMMLKNKRKIGPNTFKEYLEQHNNSKKQTYYPCK